ncbi:MAG TPA: uroporphyrinogen-III synthase [Anaerolineae bacterium]
MKPLKGRRILVTRPRAQAVSLCERLAALGGESIVLPTLEIAPLEDTSLLDRAINQLTNYHWVIFTSVNGVAALWDRLEAMRKDTRVFDSVRVAAIGPATARALEMRNVRARFVPSEYIAEAIAAGIGDVRGCRILLPRADIARETLAVELERRGAIVDSIAAYRTLPAPLDPNSLAELRRGVDAILFTSSSTVRSLVEQVGRDDLSPLTVMACIGPVTAQTARDLGLAVDVVAKEHTINGLVTALVGYFSELYSTREQSAVLLTDRVLAVDQDRRPRGRGL